MTGYIKLRDRRDVNNLHLSKEICFLSEREDCIV